MCQNPAACFEIWTKFDMTLEKGEDNAGLELRLTICTTHYQNENKLCRKGILPRVFTYLISIGTLPHAMHLVFQSCPMMSIYVSVRGS